MTNASGDVYLIFEVLMESQYLIFIPSTNVRIIKTQKIVDNRVQSRVNFVRNI